MHYLIVDGFLWEEGPNSFQPNPAILRFAKDLGILDELVLADPSLPRYVYWEDNLYALPSKPVDAVSFGLLSCKCRHPQCCRVNHPAIISVQGQEKFVQA